jgi:predicted GIY-YIG superfamily endonuclease
VPLDPPPLLPPPPAPGAWFVYVLWSSALDRSYVGIAVDVARRVRQIAATSVHQLVQRVFTVEWH